MADVWSVIDVVDGRGDVGGHERRGW
jgi:hypothetical protein